MDPCPGAGKVARRQRVRNLATAILKRTALGLLTLALLALAACAHAPARPRESSPPQAITTAPDAIPVAVAAPAASTGATGGSTPEPIAPTVAPAASTAALDASTPAPIAPTAATVASTAATDASTAAPLGSTTTADASASAPVAAIPAPDASMSAPDGSAAATMPETTPVASPAPAPALDAPTQLAGLAPEQYGDLFDRMRAGFKLEDGDDRRAVDQQLRWYASNPDYLQRAFGRADLYLYQIVTELERRGMPLELALLPVVESAFEPYAYSRARASGLWQFIPGTGSRFGLKQDWWYDGRREIVESTRAALDYLQHLHDEFDGDWLLAVAAYNCGEALVERAVDMNRAAHRPVTFWELWLPGETRAYVPKLLAMKRLVRDPETYGLEFSPIPNSPISFRIPHQAFHRQELGH